MNLKLLVVTNYPIKYRVDFFNRLYQLFDNGKRIQFVFIPDSNRHKQGVSDYTAEFSSASHFWQQNPVRNFFRIFGLINRFRPERVIVGGLNLYAFFIVIGKIFFRYKIVVWWGGTSELAPKSFIRKAVRQFLLGHMDAGMFYSLPAKDYVVSLASNILNCFILGNNTRDSRKVFVAAEAMRARSKREDAKLHVVTIGFQEKRKNTISLLKAAKILTEAGIDNFIVDVVGAGEELDLLVAFAKEHRLPVVFHGHVPNERALEILASSDCFIHPSLRDQWPQTYTESMCCGVPALLSYTSGVFNDYTDKFGGEVLFDGRDPNDIAAKMRRLLVEEQYRLKLAAAARECAFSCDGITQSEKLVDFLENV